MTESEMQDYLELFWDDGVDPVFSFWDERSDDKRLLCASHDEATVLRYVLASPLATAEQKEEAQLTLEELEAEPAAAMASFGMRCAAEWWQPEIGEA